MEVPLTYGARCCVATETESEWARNVGQFAGWFTDALRAIQKHTPSNLGWSRRRVDRERRGSALTLGGRNSCPGVKGNQHIGEGIDGYRFVAPAAA